MHVHHVALRIEVHVPYLLQERGPADDLLRMEQEVLEELELLRREVERLVVDGRDVAEPVERDRPVAQHLEPLGAAAPLQRPDAGQELVELERLREIVVGAGIESADHVLDRVARGEHQDRRVPPFPAQLRGDLEPVLLGEDDVEQDDVVLVDVGQHGGLVPVGGDVHHVALFLQALLDEPGDLPVVLHDENFHGCAIYRERSERVGTLHEDVLHDLRAGGQLQHEPPAAPRPGHRPKLAAQQAGQAAGEGQAEPGPSALPAGLGDVDVEDPLDLALGDARPLVLHRVRDHARRAAATSTRTVLPSGVCWMALPSRLTRICSTRLASVSQLGRSGGRRRARAERRFASAAGVTRPIARAGHRRRAPPRG